MGIQTQIIKRTKNKILTKYFNMLGRSNGYQTNKYLLKSNIKINKNKI